MRGAWRDRGAHTDRHETPDTPSMPGRISDPPPSHSQVHLLVRLYENAAAAAKQIRWKKTERAVDLYLALGFEKAGDHHAIAYEPDRRCQQYMVVDVRTLRERLAQMAAHAGEGGLDLRGGATWLSSKSCRTTGHKRAWYEIAAVDAMVHEHDEANGGDGASVAKDLIPLTREKIILMAAVPKLPSPATEEEQREVGEEAAARDDSTHEYDATTREAAGVHVPVYDEGEQEEQQTENGVETDTSAVNRGVHPSWGSAAAFEVLNYLLLERLRGLVVLPGRTQYFGYKMTCDAAVVRRAKRGHKKWTTVILQVLTCGIKHNAWGRWAVANMLQDAQSPNKFAKVRMWNGEDNGANVCACA